MSLKKKIQRQTNDAYKIGFSDACDFWEMTINSTKDIGVKRRAAIMDRIKELLNEERVLKTEQNKIATP